MDNSELMVILDQLERDKGIDKEILIQAVESAVSSAARKIWTVDEEEEIRVVLDRKTGKITAYADDNEIRSSEFGRIAAQTAKQVVIQKIREAEKDVIYSEFKEREGQIVSGGIYRFERGNIIVDLGKTEAFIPRSEQSPKEEFRQGDRVKAYVLEVRREARGPQIVLSRANPVLVKRLFELEVPEIYDGIVEIKSIARSVGDRTKIAVSSKDERVDCVGACVGMRGARVKNIVLELQGEKIDIVRYSEDIKEYIQAALSPAELSQIQLNYEDKVANLIVAEDQLSLAIGKRGQNVRLASELVDWELNIFTAEQWFDQQTGGGEGAKEISGEEGVTESAEQASAEGDAETSGEEAVPSEKGAEKAPAPASPLQQLQGVGEKTIAALENAGFSTLEKIAGSAPDDLTVVKGLGTMKAEKLIAQAKELSGQKESAE
ncbi:MAG: transcription termination factor NusA [Candidatus Omnitrophota bacterium]